MGHSIHNRYKIKLNKSAPNHDGLVAAIKTYLKECHHIDQTTKDPGDDDAAMSFEEFLASKQTEITKNLQLPTLVAVAIKCYSSRNSYTDVTFQHAHFRTNLNLFDEKGPFIEVKNRVVI